MIRVQREDFDVGAALEALPAGNHTVGGLAVFAWSATWSARRRSAP